MNEHDEMDAPVTRRELREELDQRFGELHKFLAALISKLDARFEAIDARFEETETRMSAEMARHARAIEESVRTQIVALDDKYKDLPARVSALEARPRRRSR